VSKKKEIPWSEIRAKYEARVSTVRELAAEYGIDPRSISRKVKKEKWTRRITEEAQARAEEKLGRELAKSKDVPTPTPTSAPTPTDVGQAGVPTKSVKAKILPEDEDRLIDDLADVILDTTKRQLARAQDLEKLADEMVSRLMGYLVAERLPKDGEPPPELMDLYERFHRMVVGKADSFTAIAKAAAEISERVMNMQRRALGLDQKQKVEVSGPGGKPVAQEIEIKRAPDFSIYSPDELLVLRGMVQKQMVAIQDAARDGGRGGGNAEVGRPG
jgi:hypothetical protein